MVDSNYCVYIHRNKRTNEIFYVGSGRSLRSRVKGNRSKLWKHIADTDGFNTEVVHTNLTKEDSLNKELELYNKLSRECVLVNSHAPKLPRKFPVEEIKATVYYDESSPTCLRWNKELLPGRNGVRHSVGDIAGNQTSTIRKVAIEGKSTSLHKVVWVLHNGDVPPGIVIDHIDGDPLNNKISNLRAITQAENLRNKKSCGKNKSGVTGVVLFCSRGHEQWRAQFNTLCGKLKQKYFSIFKHGKDEAFRLACEWRKEQIELLNLQGAGYTERHGT